ncbi:MAG: SGNH/GDSL hydrolase family protein [Gammaproteobacteria bacterium]|nr:SGNH/GDSL hydrolase family protein [Gammaproteobacteria bacterium]
MAKKAVRYQAEIIQAMSLGMGDSSLNPDDPDYAWRMLSEGDSWFTIGAIPSSNLLYELRLKKRTIVLNLGYPGDTIANISQLSGNTEFTRRLVHPNWASDWNALLLSGGGNDLIDQASDIIRATPTGTGKKAADYVNVDRLAAFKQGVQAGYRAIVALRDSAGSPNQGKPIIVHTYDYPTPRPAPATFLIAPITKPWMHPIFERYQVPKSLRAKVAEILLDTLAEALLELGKELPAFHVVDTRNTLERADIDAKGNSGDWLNEIHPNGDGYRKIANKLAAKLHKVL